MEDKNKKLPKSALTLYVKLYCKKKENMHSKNKMLKATASWISLSKYEKQQFVDKLGELQNSYKKTFANYLKNADLFMKKRCPKPITHNITQTLESTIEHNTNIEDNPSQSNGEVPNDICMEDSEEQLLNETQGVVYPKLPEPMPPSIKNAKQLFEIIQKNKGGNSNWNALTTCEKRRYQNAVLSLKKEYIKRYREYLDCLSSKELFYHYQNVSPLQ